MHPRGAPVDRATGPGPLDVGATGPGPLDVGAMGPDSVGAECGICYAYHLEVEGVLPEVVCDNSHLGWALPSPVTARGLPLHDFDFGSLLHNQYRSEHSTHEI